MLLWDGKKLSNFICGFESRKQFRFILFLSVYSTIWPLCVRQVACTFFYNLSAYIILFCWASISLYRNKKKSLPLYIFILNTCKISSIYYITKFVLVPELNFYFFVLYFHVFFTSILSIESFIDHNIVSSIISTDHKGNIFFSTIFLCF